MEALLSLTVSLRLGYTEAVFCAHLGLSMFVFGTGVVIGRY